MSRSGYSDECEGNEGYLYRGVVASAIRGKRGQALLRDLLAALDAMPVKELAANSFLAESGQFCTLGVLCHARGVDMAPLNKAALHDDSEGDGYSSQLAAKALNVARQLAAEIVYENDEGGPGYGGNETPAARWKRMRAWVAEQITKAAA